MGVKNLKSNRLALLGAIAAVSGTVIGLAVPAVQSQSPATVKIDGSSTVFPVTEAVAEEFQKAKGGAVKVTVGISGTGGGFKKFCTGETDISNASRPILRKEIDVCAANGIKYIEIPVAYDALTVVVNTKNNWADKLTVAELKKMWEPGAEGKITNWSQIRSGFPDAPLKLFGPGPDSGTFDYFTEAIVGKSKSSRKDFTPSEDDNVLVQGVGRDKNALGYFGLAYYENNKKRLKGVAIDSGKGPVYPARKNVDNGTYYPLSRPLFIYVKASSISKPEVKAFVEYYLTSAGKLVPQVGYVGFKPNEYEMAMDRFKDAKTGSIFGGKEQIGLTAKDLLTRQLVD
ncbi:protein sphX [Leptolyngbya sp. 'hensonii']|nr:protein sphX [Leptolyngbya sp. 'hensonii']